MTFKLKPEECNEIDYEREEQPGETDETPVMEVTDISEI